MKYRTNKIVCISLYILLANCGCKRESQSKTESVRGDAMFSSVKIFAYEYRFSSNVIPAGKVQDKNASCLYAITVQQDSSLINNLALRFTSARSVTAHAVDTRKVDADTAEILGDAGNAFTTTNHRVVEKLHDDDYKRTNSALPFRQADEEETSLSQDALVRVIDIYKKNETKDADECPKIHPDAKGGVALPSFPDPTQVGPVRFSRTLNFESSSCYDARSQGSWFNIRNAVIKGLSDSNGIQTDFRFYKKNGEEFVISNRLFIVPQLLNQTLSANQTPSREDRNFLLSSLKQREIYCTSEY